MWNDERIVVLIARANPLVAAGLEAALGSQEDFHVVERCAPENVPRLPRASVAVTDCERVAKRMRGECSRGLAQALPSATARDSLPAAAC